MGTSIRALIAEGCRDVLQLFAALILAPVRVVVKFIQGNHYHHVR